MVGLKNKSQLLRAKRYAEKNNKTNSDRILNRVVTIFFMLVSLLCSGYANAEQGPIIPTAISMSLGGSKEKDAFHGDIMLESEFTEIITGRAGLSFFLSDNDGIFGGIEGGVRAALPGLISPFVGGGLFLGQWTEYEPAANDGIDNDGDNIIDEYDEEKEVTDDLLSLYPEAGLHVWLGEHLRLTVAARYFVSTKGRESDRALYSSGIAFHF